MKQENFRNLFLLLLMVSAPVFLSAQTVKRFTADEYINMFKDLAVSEMKRTSIPASITLAQGLLESGNGNSRLAKEANNHFGIKCKKDWTGRTINVDDDALQECFRAYDKAEDSYEDHSHFLIINQRYAFLFDLDPMDYKGWAKGLKQAGYATNPRYSDLLIEVIERYKLDAYDAGNKRRDKNEKVEPRQEDQPPVIAENEKPKEEKFEYNGVPAYVVKSGETIESITKARKMMRFEIRKYNDLDKTDILEPGTIIYLKPKKRKGSKDFHIVQEGESMYYISQLERMKIKLLYKRNLMKPGQEPLAGEKLYLRKKRDVMPALAPDPSFAAKKRMLKIEPVKTPNPVKDNRQKPAEIVSKSAELPKKENVLVIKEDEVLINEKAKPGNVVIEATVSKPATIKKDPLADIDTLLPKKMEETLKYLSTISGEINKVTETKPKTDVSANKAQNPIQKPVPQPSPSIGNPDFHMVQSGETLFSISKKYNLEIDKIKEWNSMKDNSLALGQKLKLNAGSPKNIQQAQLPDAEFHEVQQGESLYGISRKYGLSIDQIKQINGLEDNSISIGQKLKVK